MELSGDMSLMTTLTRLARDAPMSRQMAQHRDGKKFVFWIKESRNYGEKSGRVTVWAEVRSHIHQRRVLGFYKNVSGQIHTFPNINGRQEHVTWKWHGKLSIIYCFYRWNNSFFFSSRSANYTHTLIERQTQRRKRLNFRTVLFCIAKNA